MKTLNELSSRLTELAGRQLSIAYYIGLQRGLKQVGITDHKWDDTDQANVQLLVDQFSKQLEIQINEIRAVRPRTDRASLTGLITQSVHMGMDGIAGTRPWHEQSGAAGGVSKTGTPCHGS